MTNHLLIFVLGSAVSLAQPAISPPAIGTVRDSAGTLHAVIGVAGNFISTDTGISSVVSAAFSGSAGLIKTDSELLVLDAANEITSRYDAPAPLEAQSRALFAFDRVGTPALAYYSGTLFWFDHGQLTPVNWTGDAVSIALTGPHSASAIVHHDDQVWKVHITLPAGDVENEALIPGVNGPVLLLHNAGLLFTRDNNIVLRDHSGVERTVSAEFQVDLFEQMGKDWIAVREAAGGRLFALRITPENLDLYQLPEVTQ